MRDSKNILIVKLSAIGDVIHTLPVAHALRKSYPDAKISWIVGNKAYKLLENNPVLDEVILFPRAEWKESFKQNKLKTVNKVFNFIKNLREEDFDLAIDLQGLFKSGIVSYLSGADKRIGYSDAREGSTMFYNHRIDPVEEDIAVVDKYLNLVKAIGVDIEEVGFDFKFSSLEEEKVANILKDLKIDNNKKLVAINPFTSWSSKNWLKERYALLADKLIQELNCEVIFTGGPGDRVGIEEIQAKMKEISYNLGGRTNLKELAKLYSRIDAFIGGDTGPMHLAAALGTSVVAIMGPTPAKTHGPYGRGHVVVDSNVECKSCWQRVCDKDLCCMREISVDKVIKAVEEILRGEDYEEDQRG